MNSKSAFILSFSTLREIWRQVLRLQVIKKWRLKAVTFSTDLNVY
jgi:hypothetical protein